MVRNNGILMVCAAALMVFAGGSAAQAQDEAAAAAAQAMEAAESMKAESEAAAAPAADLPVPTGEAPAPAVAAEAPAEVTATPVVEEEMAPEPEPPAPVLSATSPETPALQASAARPAGTTERIVTLRDAVAVGVLTNPETEAVENNRRATDEELKQAKALYLPSVDFQADTGYEMTDDDPDNGAGVDEDLWRKQASLTLTQMLFDGFETKYENERQHHRVRSASHRVRETAEFVGLDVIESYLDILRQRELLAIAVENLAQHEQILGQIQDGASAGRSTGADVEQTKARLAAARTQESSVRQALRLAEASYRRRVGDMPQTDIEVPVAPKDRLEENIEDQVKQVLTHSPTIDTYEADVNVAEAERKGTASTLYPQVDFQLNGTVAEDVGGVEGDSTGASALVVANWNLYRGGGDNARIREHVYRHAQAKNARNDVARSVERDVRQTWANMVAAGEKAEQFRAQAEANAMVVQAYKDQFNLDRRTLLDVLDSQNEWFVSRSNAINNGYLEMFAVYRLLALQGDLLPTLGVSYPKEANPADKS
jgi:adhesin transport system outer membrane protein